MSVVLVPRRQGFPDISTELSFFQKAFDRKKALEKGGIIPAAGVDPDYDNAVAGVTAVEKKLDRVLANTQQLFNDKSIK